MIDRLTLRQSGWLLIAGFAVHNGDHARRGLDAIRESVVWAGTFVMVVATVVLTLIFTGHERAPIAAAVAGPAIALGVMASHLPPDWGPLSDPLITGEAGAITFVAVACEVIAAGLMGLVAWRILRTNGYQLEVAQPAW